MLTASAISQARADSARVGSPAWFNAFNAQRGASPSTTGTGAGSATTKNIAPNSPAGSAGGIVQSIANFTQAARAIAQAEAAQAQAQSTQTQAAQNARSVPDGLTPGGLWVNPATIAANPSLWSGASLPTITTSSGATGAVGHTGGKIVTVNQTAKAADLTWTTFNVGTNTTLRFNQGGSDWTVLNRVDDPHAAPSQILGAISAPGEVLLLNANGILFGAGSQVNVGAFVASTANLATAQFNGITSAQTANGAYLPVFSGATAPITVQAGASITTNPPASAADRGGFVLLLGQSVENKGQITTTNGQTVLAAGQSFVIRDGYSADNNPTSTTLGLEVDPTGAGGVTNTGLIQALTGDITLTAETVMQAGVVLSSTTVAQRGTIHLLTNTTDTASAITFAPGSLTAIEPEDDGSTATDTAREALIAQSATNNAARAAASLLGNQVALPDQQYESRIEIVSGGNVEFQNGSLALSTGGQIAAYTAGRLFADSGATLSAAGSIDTLLPATANTLTINVQGFDLRDAPANRDTGALASQNINIAINHLVPIGTQGFLYTGGGLLEVSAYVAGIGHTIGEWSSVGGSITLNASEVVAQQGSIFNIAGGRVSYAAGSTPNTWLIGNNGKIYNVNTAPADVTYTGVYNGFTVSQPRWGITQTFISPLIAPASTYNSSYTVGRDAGTLTIDAPTTVMEATIAAGVSAGEFQIAARPASVADPFTLAQTVVPLPGTLVLGPVTLPGTTPVVSSTDTSITGDGQPLASSLSLGTPIPADRVDTTWLAASVLNDGGLGGLTVVTKGAIRVDAPVTLADGGIVSLLAPSVAISAPVTVRGGQVTIGNYSPTYFTAKSTDFQDAANTAGTVVPSAVTFAAGGAIDTRGVFTNLSVDPTTEAGEAFINGGAVTIDTSGVVTLAGGSTIDASAGGSVLANASAKGGAGGAISITAYDPADLNAAPASTPVTIAATLRSLGSGSAPCTACAGGALTLNVPSVWIGTGAPADAATVDLTPGFFQAGFGNYTITGQNGVTVAPNTQIAVVQPIQQFTAATLLTPSGTDPAAAFTVGLPALYTPNTATAVMVQRPGASIMLRSGDLNVATGAITIGAGAVISVDPLQAIGLETINQGTGTGTQGQITIDGSLIAPAGTISIVNDQYEGTSNALSIWLGGTSVLDVSAQAATAVDNSGRAFGSVPNGGSIHIGGLSTLTADGSIQSTNAFIVVQPGAVISAAGTSAMLDPSAGQTLTGAIVGRPSTTNNVLVASNGGSISFDSESGIYLGGQITAPAGGAGAQGGTLSINLVTPDYTSNRFSGGVVPGLAAYKSPRELVVTSGPAPSSGVEQPGQAFADSAFGQTVVSTGQIEAGGFDVLNLSSGDAILFNGSATLSAGRSISLTTAILGSTGLTGTVSINAPYVTLAGSGTTTHSGVTFRISDTSDASAQAAEWQPSIQSSQATLTVNAADIDVSGNLYVGVDSPIISVPPSSSTPCAQTSCPVADLPGFASMTLSSSGDIRFLPSTPVGNDTTLTMPGNLSLVAGQIYPVAGTTAIVTAGFTVDPTTGLANYDGTLTVAAAPGPVPAPPLTAGGQLTLLAGVIDQGGVLRAPDGDITLGQIGTNRNVAPNLTPEAFSSQIVLLPGSITSVSMNGLTIPYGGTSDGTTYTLNGVTAPALQPQLAINAQSIQVQAGATIDVSGGGVLAGAGFVAGRGGSTDITETPLLALTASGTVTDPSAATNLVYAIIPGFADSVAPPTATASTFTGPLPSPGNQITIGAGVPGLAAGTYTLLPGSDALLPGAFRVQLATTVHTVLPGATALGNGSYLVNGYQGVADTGIRAALPIVATVTPGAAILNDAQYNQTSYAAFELAQAALFATPRATLTLPADSKTLLFGFPATNAPAALALQLQGSVLSTPGAGGLGGIVEVSAQSPIEIIANGTTPTAGMVSILGSDLSGLDANTLIVGGTLLTSGTAAGELNSGSSAVYVRDGATLQASQVLLVSTGELVVERGASITTIGEGTPSLDANAGLVFNNNNNTVLAVSNGPLSFQAVTGGGPIALGSCGSVCSGAASLLSEGTIETVTTGAVTLDPTTRLGTAALNLSASIINFGTTPAGTTGLTFTTDVLQGLLTGNTEAGVPALQFLTLSATDSVNFYGTFNLDTGNPVSGQSTLQSLQFNSPAIYGAPGVNASLTTGTFIWNGVATPGNTASVAPGIWTPGTGTGASSLSISANTIVLGYGPNDRAQDQVALGRVILGFDTVALSATGSIAGNNQGSLSVYQSGTQGSSGTLLSGTGGNLTLTTPLLTGAPGSVFAITAGGNLTIAGPATQQAPATVSAQGTSLTLNAANISDNTSIVLPSGRLVMNATSGAISLGSTSQLDLAGISTTLADQTTYGWGGSVTLQAATGGITQMAGGSIDVSATNANAGSVTLIAPGVVNLAGTVNGAATAGYAGGSFSVRAGGLGASDPSTGFTALNASLDTGGFFGGRSFELLTGDLTIGAGTTITASTVSVSVDNGSLTVGGTVNASGVTPGTIHLSAGGDLTLAAGSVLDAHGTVKQVDSYGQSIDSENTASVTLTSANGTLSIASPSAGLAAPVIDVSAPPGVTCAMGLCGQVMLNAPRVNGDGAGDVAISVPVGVTIDGAGSVVVAAFQTYNNAPATGITQTWFDQVPNVDATTFMNAAVTAGVLNPALTAKLAGLMTPTLAPVFHLLPGVQIEGAAQADGLTVSTDLDLSQFRYQSVAVPGRTPGLTEPGSLVIRSGDGLTILGSINDGFTDAPQLCETAATCTASSGLFTYWELAQPLAPTANGSLALSWSIRLVAGADLAAADSRTVLPSDQLTAEAAVPVPGSTRGATDSAGSMELYDPHPQPFNSDVSAAVAAEQLPGWSVIRTGTGNLDLLAGGSIDEGSTYAIYTSGATPQAAADSAYNLPRGTVATTASLSVTLKSTSIGSHVVPAGTVLSDGTTTFVTTKAVTLRGNGSGSTVQVVAQGTGYDDTAGTTLTVVCPSSGCTFSNVTAVATNGLNNNPTVLGTDGQATNNGATFESLVSSYQAYYPTGGGNLLISAGANIVGYLATPNSGTGVLPMDGVGNWLWRQGEGTGASATGSTASTAWWINFGTLAPPLNASGGSALSSGSTVPVPTLTGFTGIGTLGGGNVTILAGGTIGATAASSVTTNTAYTVSGAIDVAIASTGRVGQGATSAAGLVQTGGGVLTIDAGGALNGGGTSSTNTQANGTLTDTRGAIDVLAASIGQISLSYGIVNAAGDPRSVSPLTAAQAIAQGGPIVVPGDATVTLDTRSDLVLGGAGDPTRLAEQNLTPANLTAGGAATGLTWFSLWQPGTAINLDSAGGNLVVSTQAVVQATGGQQENAIATDNRFLYPPTLTAVATSGSIYAGTVADLSGTVLLPSPSSIELAPSPTGQLELLAAQSFYGDSMFAGLPQSFDISGASTAAIPTPMNPAFEAVGTTTSNLTANIGAQPLSLFAFEADTASGTLHAGDPVPARIYAGGDIVGLRYGETLCFGGASSPCPQQPTSGISPDIWYISGKAVRIMAGGDIVEPGSIYILQPNPNPKLFARPTIIGAANPPASSAYTSTSGLIVNNNASDISVIQAGGNIIYANATMAGPGQLYVQAGGTVYQGNMGVLQSLGPLSNGVISAEASRTGGAGITVVAGVSTTGPDWASFAQTYLAPAMGYGPMLLDYLQSNFGYTGDLSGAPRFFEALSVAQQRAFLLQIYFDQLADSDVEFNNPASVHYKSYVTGKAAIATLFPTGSTSAGDITMFGDSSISTQFGGAVTLLTPGGATTIGNTNPPPVSLNPAGVLTQGTGDVDIFSQGSVILGQSRIFTTFGGNIVIWSAAGDINAGDGVKSTQLVSSTEISYGDLSGLITLVPGIPTTGAGIATLAPIPGTPLGNLDLVAPLGIIDAGEAGIRVSGNANIAALAVVNAANVQVGGKSSGLSTVAVPNVSALSAASSAAAAATQTAQSASAAAGQNTQQVPSTITVEFVGFGDL